MFILIVFDVVFVQYVQGEEKDRKDKKRLRNGLQVEVLPTSNPLKIANVIISGAVATSGRFTSCLREKGRASWFAGRNVVGVSSVVGLLRRTPVLAHVPALVVVRRAAGGVLAPATGTIASLAALRVGGWGGFGGSVCTSDLAGGLRCGSVIGAPQIAKLRPLVHERGTGAFERTVLLWSRLGEMSKAELADARQRWTLATAVGVAELGQTHARGAAATRRWLDVNGRSARPGNEGLL